MTAYKNKGKLVGALLLAVTSTVALSGTAQAQSAWPWYSPFVSSSAPPVQSVPARRARTPVQVSSITPVSSSDCFWCNRRVFISGLSF